jgi:hypothetical protein
VRCLAARVNCWPAGRFLVILIAKFPHSGRLTNYSWHKNFVETGCSVRHAKLPGRQCVSGATVKHLRESFVRIP